MAGSGSSGMAAGKGGRKEELSGPLKFEHFGHFSKFIRNMGCHLLFLTRRKSK